MINKTSLWDKNLSLDAVGLWARLLAKPDDWSVCIKDLARSCGCGRDKIQKLVNELIKEGYAHRGQPKQCVKGKMLYDTVEYTIFESKKSADEIKEILPQPCFPCTELPRTENQALLIKERELKKEETNTQSAAEAAPAGECQKNILIPRQSKKRGARGRKVDNPDLVSHGALVKLLPSEYHRLCQEHGKAHMDWLIKKMDLDCGAKGTSYEDYNLALRLWLESAWNKPGYQKTSVIPLKSSEIDRALRDRDGNLVTDCSHLGY